MFVSQPTFVPKGKSCNHRRNRRLFFDDLKPGVYKFVFEKERYKKVIKEKVTVKVDEGFQLDIEMLQDNTTDVMPSTSHFLYN
jgi:hypothetical protein